MLHHFTNADSLMKILDSKSFIHFYCYEQTDFLSFEIKSLEKMAFAMICFADILKNERNRFKRQFKKDSFIVMNKDWAIQNGVAPVLYAANASVTAEALTCLMKNIAYMNKSKEKITDETFLENFNGACKQINLIMGYLRKYSGNYHIKTKRIDNNENFSQNVVQFYLEREWRHIPSVNPGDNYFIESTKFINKEYVDAEQAKLLKYRLKFDKSDIEGIYVPKRYKTKVAEILKCKFDFNEDEVRKIFIK